MIYEVVGREVTHEGLKPRVEEIEDEGPPPEPTEPATPAATGEAPDGPIQPLSRLNAHQPARGVIDPDAVGGFHRPKDRRLETPRIASRPVRPGPGRIQYREPTPHAGKQVLPIHPRSTPVVRRQCEQGRRRAVCLHRHGQRSLTDHKLCMGGGQVRPHRRDAARIQLVHLRACRPMQSTPIVTHRKTTPWPHETGTIREPMQPTCQPSRRPAAGATA
jgi:hypothetical protein